VIDDRVVAAILAAVRRIDGHKVCRVSFLGELDVVRPTAVVTSPVPVAIPSRNQPPTGHRWT
jgi:hypothetical protein